MESSDQLGASGFRRLRALAANPAAAVGLLSLLALVPRLLFLRAGLVLVDDELHYAESLSRFLRGDFLGGISDYWSFLYPLAAVPLAALARDAETGLRLLSVLAGAACAAPAYLIARRLWGPTQGWLAGLLVALHPMLILFSARAMTESLYTFLLLVALGCFLEGLARGGRRTLAFAAIAMGLAWLTRQEAQFAFAVVLLAWIATPRGEEGRRPLRSRLRAAVMMVALFALVAAPFVGSLRAKTGIWTAGAKATVNVSSPQIWQTGLEREKHLYSLNADGAERAVDGLKSRNPMRAFWENRRQIAARYPANLSASLAMFPTLLSSPFLLLLAPLGIFGRRWASERRAEEVALLLLGLLPIALYATFAIDHRYFVPYLPIYLLWAGAGGAQFLQWWKESISPRARPAAVILALVCLSLVPYTVHKHGELRSAQPREYRAIGRWIREHDPAGSRILARSGCSISYYAGVPEASYLPWAEIPGLLRYARHHGYGLLALEEAYVRQSRPLLAGLLDGPLPEGVEEIGRFPHAEVGRIALLRIAPIP